MEFEIESGKFVKYLEVIEGKGTGTIMEAKISSNSDGLVCVATDAINSRVVKSILRKETFKKFSSSEDTINATQIGKVIAILKRFDGMISVKVQKNRLYVASEKRDGDVALSSPDMISDVKFPTFKYDIVFDADASMFKESLSNGSAIESETFKLEGSKGHFKIITGTETGSAITEKIKVDVKDFEVYFKAGTDSCFKFLDGKVRVSASANRPCMFERKDKEMMVTTILAPIDVGKQLEEKKE